MQKRKKAEIRILKQGMKRMVNSFNCVLRSLFRQFVTETSHRFYQITGCAQFGAQLGYIGINRTCVPGICVAPDDPQQLFPAVHLSQFFGKGDEKIVFYGSELYFFIADDNQVPVGINGEWAYSFDLSLNPWLSRALHYRLDPEQQNSVGKWFCNIIVRSDLEADHLVDFLAFCRQYYDRYSGCFRILLEDLAYFHTRHAGEHQV